MTDTGKANKDKWEANGRKALCVSRAQFRQLERFNHDNGDVEDFLLAVGSFNLTGEAPESMEGIAWVLFNWILDANGYHTY